MTQLAAGFECGHLGWCDQDLLIDSRHTPETDMVAHYRAALDMGVTVMRDGLPWRHDPAARIAAAPPGARVIWDLSHFDPPPEPVFHAGNCARALPDAPHVLAVNEPSIWPMLCGRSREDAVQVARDMMTVVAALRPATRFYTCDPMHAVDDATFDATDALVDTGRIGCVGVNYYPHCSRTPLADILDAVSTRYGLPVALTETGWHEGHENNRHYPDIANRWNWLAHVHAEIARSGVQVEFACWYPWLPQPAWGQPGTSEIWPCYYPGIAA